jgi:hypothetical protein
MFVKVGQDDFFTGKVSVWWERLRFSRRWQNFALVSTPNKRIKAKTYFTISANLIPKFFGKIFTYVPTVFEKDHGLQHDLPKKDSFKMFSFLQLRKGKLNISHTTVCVFSFQQHDRFIILYPFFNYRILKNKKSVSGLVTVKSLLGQNCKLHKLNEVFKSSWTLISGIDRAGCNRTTARHARKFLKYLNLIKSVNICEHEIFAHVKLFCTWP